MKKTKITALLWIALLVLAIGLLFARAVFPEYLWLTAVLGVLLIADLAGLVQQNRMALKSRSAAYGLNSIVTILLVLAIVGVGNFLGSRYPKKLDLTKQKLHTLSDQTVKVVKDLKGPVKAELFAKFAQKEEFSPLLESYKALNPKFEVELIDPDKEPARARQLGIKKYGTLHLVMGPRDSKIEEISEEKLTNALIKLTQEKTPTLCTLTGHGEKSFSSAEADGYDGIRKALLGQAYEVSDLSLVQEAKIPAKCDALAVIGPTKPFFEPEVKLLRDYLAQGGRMVVALDFNLKGTEYAPEILNLLSSWQIKGNTGLIVDPLSKMLGVDASVPIVASYSKEHPIAKDFGQGNSFFPLVRPLEIVKDSVSGLNVQWLGQTTPRSWVVTDVKALASGQVRFQEGTDKMGPFTVAAVVSGKRKDTTASRETRLVAFGTSQFATNNYARFGSNQDFFLNAVSWLVEDENLISIRSKEEGAGRVELTQKTGTTIFLLTVIIIPLLVAVGGIILWVIRRRL